MVPPDCTPNWRRGVTPLAGRQIRLRRRKLASKRRYPQGAAGVSAGAGAMMIEGKSSRRNETAYPASDAPGGTAPSRAPSIYRVRAAIPNPESPLWTGQSVKTLEKEATRIPRWQKCDGAQASYCGGYFGAAAVVVHPVEVQDRDGTRLVLRELAGRFSRLRLIWADGRYRGFLSGWVQKELGCWLEIVPRRAWAA